MEDLGPLGGVYGVVLCLEEEGDGWDLALSGVGL